MTVPASRTEPEQPMRPNAPDESAPPGPPGNPGNPGDQASRLRAMMEQADAAAHAQSLEDDAHTQPPADEPVREQGGSQARPRPRVITIASGKGGVGKTSLSVGLAATLARGGQRVTLLDGDLGLANADVLCGINASVHLGHALEYGRSLCDIAVDAPGGFRLIPGGSGVSRLSEMDSDHRERLIVGIADLAETTDLAIVDCGAGVGTGVLEFVNAADFALVVTTPEPTSIADAYALIKLLVTRPRDGAGGPVSFALVVNNTKDAREAARVHERIDAVTRRFLDTPVPFAGWVPSDKAVPDAVRSRRPFVLKHPKSPASRGVIRLADGISARFSPVSAPHARERNGLVRALRGMTRGKRTDRRDPQDFCQASSSTGSS